MKILVLFRGLPGAGKSTIARSLCNAVLSADQYFIQSDGTYCYDWTSIKDAHRQCWKNTETAMRLGIEAIGVANTFTQEWELEAYELLAEQYGYQVHSLIVENRHGNCNTHDVPDEIVQTMRDRFEIKL